MIFYILSKRLSKYTSTLNHMSSLSHTSHILHFVVYIIFSLIETKVSFQRTGSAELAPFPPALQRDTDVRRKISRSDETRARRASRIIRRRWSS